MCYFTECTVRQNDSWVIACKNQQVTVHIVTPVPATLSNWQTMIETNTPYDGQTGTITNASFTKKDQSFVVELTIKDQKVHMPAFWVKADNDYKYDGNSETFVYTGNLDQYDGTGANIGSDSDSQSVGSINSNNDIGDQIMSFDAAFRDEPFCFDDCNNIVGFDGKSGDESNGESNDIQEISDMDIINAPISNEAAKPPFREYRVDKQLIAQELIQPVKTLMHTTDKKMQEKKTKIIQQCDKIKDLIEDDNLFTDMTTQQKEQIDKTSKMQRVFDISGVSLQVKKI